MSASKDQKSKPRHGKNKQSLSEKLFGRFSKGKGRKSKGKKTVVVTPASHIELKEHYTATDVINYRSQLIRSVSDDERKRLVIQKLRLCCVIFDLSATHCALPDTNTADTSASASERKKMDGINGSMLALHKQSSLSRLTRTLSQQEEAHAAQMAMGVDKKRQMLVEMVEFVSTQKWWDEDILRELTKCVTANLFRALPTPTRPRRAQSILGGGDDDEEPFLDPQWLHLQLVYELCLRFLISNDIDKKVMQRYLGGAFVVRLIHLFESEDIRERDYLKTILHRIYGRFMPLRVQIRAEISHECHRHVYGDVAQHTQRSVFGLAEFLDIFSSIINGFSVPVKAEHIVFLKKVLLPLHKCDRYGCFFQQLADCCVLFVNKEQSTATPILHNLLRYWPRLSPRKEALFLREMLNVMGALVEHSAGFAWVKYKGIVLRCVERIAQCMCSAHSAVAEQAIALWKDTVLLYLAKCAKKEIWARLFMVTKEIEATHWSRSIRQLSAEVALYYERVDAEHWKRLQTEYEQQQKSTAEKPAGETGAEAESERTQRASKWAALRKTAQLNEERWKAQNVQSETMTQHEAAEVCETAEADPVNETSAAAAAKTDAEKADAVSVDAVDADADAAVDAKVDANSANSEQKEMT